MKTVSYYFSKNNNNPTKRLKRNTITEARPSVRLSVHPSVTRLYLMNRDSYLQLHFFFVLPL